MQDVYIVYDEIGQAAIYCMNCLNQLLCSRDILVIGDKSAVVQKRNSSYNQKPINALHDDRPTVFNAILCNECVKKNDLDINHLIEQVKLGIRANLKYNGTSDEEIEKVLSKGYNLSKEV